MECEKWKLTETLHALRINLISLGRLIEIVSTKAGTYPTLDPSFYVTSPIVLSSLEVSLSILAASLPVFWPMLKFDMGSIIVTTEVTVTQEPGFAAEDGRKGGGGGGGRSPRSTRAPWARDSKAGRWEARVVPMVPLGGGLRNGRGGGGGGGGRGDIDEEALIGPLPGSTPKLNRSMSKASVHIASLARGYE